MHSTLQRAVNVISWTPPRCRYDPDRPFVFNIWLNLLFAAAGSFTVANLYYSYPILNVLAREFGVSYDDTSNITLALQAGYCTGLVFLCPLGDIVKRRPFILSLIVFTATMWIGICVTSSFNVFLALCFITGVTTVTPQIMLPLIAELAPPHKRAAAMSIGSAGIMAGLLLARLLSGILTNYTSWRSIFYLALALQWLVFALLWLFLPDYPRINRGLGYLTMLFSILRLVCKEALLIQICLIVFLTNITFTNFWSTLSFLLGSPPYNYDSAVISLFALVGLVTIIGGAVWGRKMTDRFVPLLTVILGLTFALVGATIGTYVAKLSVAGPALEALFLDFGITIFATASRNAIYPLMPTAKNRLNTAYMIAAFAGQLAGTASGTRVYTRAGWIGSGSLGVGALGLALVLCFVRGPYEDGWLGWSGGFSPTKRDKTTADGRPPRQEVDLHKAGLDELESKETPIPVGDEKGVNAVTKSLP